MGETCSLWATSLPNSVLILHLLIYSQRLCNSHSDFIFYKWYWPCLFLWQFCTCTLYEVPRNDTTVHLHILPPHYNYQGLHFVYKLCFMCAKVKSRAGYTSLTPSKWGLHEIWTPQRHARNVKERFTLWNIDIWKATEIVSVNLYQSFFPLKDILKKSLKFSISLHP